MKDEWKETKINLKNKHRIHLRPIQQIVETTQKFQAQIKVSVEGAECNPKSILELMIFAGDLVNSKNEEMTAMASGDDADEALAALGEVFEAVLSEE